MRPEIQIWLKESLEGYRADVMVMEGTSRTKHKVTFTKEDLHRLAGYNVKPEVLIEESFRFLLKREPKESILRMFDLPLVSKYFPEYEQEMRRRLMG